MIEHQISILKWFLKDHVTLKIGIMAAEISVPYQSVTLDVTSEDRRIGISLRVQVLKELRTARDLAPRATKVMARSLGHAMSTLVVQERHLWLCLVDIGTPTKFGSSRFLYPRLASSAMQPVTWPSSSGLHRSRVRRSNKCPASAGSCCSTRPPVAAPSLLVAEGGPLRPPPLPHRIRSSLQKAVPLS